MGSSVLAADWVVPVAAPPIRDGCVVVDADRVAWVGPLADLPATWRAAPVDERTNVLVPGLVNAHTHLQYTRFAEIGQSTYSSFEEWAEAFEVVYHTVTDETFWHESAIEGAREAISCGTTTFADVITNDAARGVLARFGVSGIEYLEVIGQYERRWRESARAEFVEWLERPTTVGRGVSPHAPYSLDGSVVSDLVTVAKDRGLRVHSHVGESAVESNLYAFGDRNVLEIYGDLRDEFELVRNGGSGKSTAQYADSIDLLGPYSHLAHAIYLDRRDRDLLLERGTQVALCPRSNAVLGVGPPPVAAYLDEGHEIAVGTDSLASTPSLDLMADVAALAETARRQGYRGDDLGRRLLRAATLGGAKALGMRGRGTIAIGGPADLAGFEIDVDQDVEATLVEQGAGNCVLTVAGGNVLHDRRDSVSRENSRTSPR